MATHLHHLLILLLFTLTHQLPSQTAVPEIIRNGGFILGVSKDAETLQYTTQLLVGTPQVPTKLILHLSGHSLWLNCQTPSSSLQFIRHNSLHCLMAKSSRNKKSTVCDIQLQNPVTGESSSGDLAAEVVAAGGGGDGQLSTVDRFLLSCSPDYLLKGLVNGAKGVLGFGRSKIGFQSQIVNNFDIDRKFTMCLSSDSGFIISGKRLVKSLSYTPLISIDGRDDAYYVSVKSVKINGRKTVLRPIERVEVSSVIPYTRMKREIYEIFSKAYVAAASAMNMTVVDPVAPFGVCFRSRATVPEIELVFQSEMVKWRIQRRNLMVKVSDLVMCLGFVDGGLGMNESMVLGGYQLEDHILEFNLGTSMMGFSSSLLMEGSSCSNIKASILAPTDSL